MGTSTSTAASHPAAREHPAAKDLVLEAKRLILGEDASFDPPQGVARLRQARALGDGEAAALEATLAAAGAWRPQSWGAALDLLSLAAERDHAGAQGQLRLLAEADPAETDWTALRRRIRLESWLQAPPRRPVCEAPRIRLAERFVSPAVCDWLIGRARGQLQPARVVDGYGDAARLGAGRTNSDFIIDILQADVLLCLLRQKIAAFVAMPTVCFEPPQVLHYAPGQEFRPHFDFLQRQGGQTAYMGDRALTFLLYLNADYEGGETDFPRAGFRHKGRAGDCIVFANLDPAGRPDPLTLHAGLPPLEGEKWLLSQWIHNQPFSLQGPANAA